VTIEQFEELLTESDVAAQFKIPKVTLQQSRHHKRWPLKYIKLGRLVRYRASDVRAFLEARTRCGIHPAAPPPRKRKPKALPTHGRRA
jgi:hypothetical protein